MDPLFGQLVKESAETVQNREDVDSVPIIDDIRYHVTLLHGDGELSGADNSTLVEFNTLSNPNMWVLSTVGSLQMIVVVV